ncbi:SIMPL domain-containing protein [Sphingomicrobium clamense]|uniref:SIMPL domain-containing protein n=1 Tax=Sphingomicrobium clamense TaxID=2851013 RepID=A0ABS6V838_9SPHN|nr:SIMPL domain-containing protein [Sphingomicrobium sp. B8]MBW0145738.1 SIMPL domain-containing protein [Sphingomicrobium sp. B8]
MTSTRILPILAAALALNPATAMAQVQTAPALAEDATRLDLTVTGKTTRVPDIATISTGVQTRARTAQEAIRQNAQRMSQVLAALREAGVAERDIRTSQLSLNPQYDYRRESGEGPVLTGYVATNQVSVRFRDIAKSGEIIDALVSVGANQINGPMLSIDDVDAAMDEARANAIAEGRQRAELYAAAMGKRVTRVVMVSEGRAANRPPIVMNAARSMAMEDAADTQIVPGEQDVAVVLQMSFDLE